MATTSDTARAEAYAAGVRDMQIAHYWKLQHKIPEALDHLSSLQDGLRNLHALLETDALARPVLNRLQEASMSARRILTACGEHWENVWKPTEQSAYVAQRVFAIPELCEHILRHLPTNRDLLSAMRTNQAMAAAVRGSPSIQQALGFAPAKHGHWYTPFDYRNFQSNDWSQRGSFTRDPLTCDLGAVDQQQGWAWLDAAFSFPRSDDKQPGLMAVFHDAQICTPSIYEMQCHVECCDRWQDLHGYDHENRRWSGDEDDTESPPAPKPIAPVRNPRGITVGDLYRATVHLKDEHRLCPYAKEGQMNLYTGNTQVHVSFRGQLKLLPDDPVRDPADPHNGWGKPSPPSQRDLEFDAQYRMRTNYAKAKMDALTHGKPIPTLVEYASHLAAQQIETGRHLVDEASDLLQSTTIDGQAAEASGWDSVS
ncbi:hypothetical protein LTR15_011916 [Elasticomyces elasticus]|nr:hypothetical protein LTR15_011916 [Elasticomyces elasticus]